MSAPATTTTQQKEPLFHAATANEWGQVTGLEPHAHYFVIRKPTKELTREKSQQFVSDLQAFLHQQRETTEKRVRELDERYGATAKAKAQELREQLEKRFEELTREFETRVEKLEHELGEKAERIFQKAKPQHDGNGPTAETPGEMPTGDDHAPGPAPATGTPAANAGATTPAGASTDAPTDAATDAAGADKTQPGGRKKPARKD